MTIVDIGSLSLLFLGKEVVCCDSLRTMPDYSEAMCRVCLQDYRDDFESVFTEDDTKTQLSDLGVLYEELVQMTLNYKSGEPHFLCNYCNLQLKLFHKFKTKAVETCATFKTLHETESFATPTSPVLNVIEIKSEFNHDEIKGDSNLIILQNDSEEMSEEEATENVEDDEDDADGNEFEDVQYLDDTDMDESSKGNVEKINIDTPGKARHVKRRTRPSSRIYPCKRCNREFGKMGDLIKHRKAQHKREMFPCNQCPKKCYSEDRLRVHINEHFGLPAYQCGLCRKSFKQKVHYKNHMKNHQNKRDVQCHLCGKGFLNKSDLKIHMRMHTDERRYECDICGKRFRAITHMKNHRYTHLGKTMECEYCQQMYTTPATLKIHIQSVHQNLCPYLCSICNRWFKRKHHLVAHLRVHSPKDDNPADLTES